MSNMVIVKPLTPTAAVTASTGTGGANVATSDPKEVWASTAGGAAVEFIFDFGANVSINSLFIGYVGGAATAPTLTWTSGTAGGYAFTNLNGVAALAPSAHASPLRRHCFRQVALIAHRHHSVVFTPGVAGTTTIGIVCFGLAFQPIHNQEWGGGRQVIDTGTKERLRGGGFGFDEGVRKASYQWTFGDLLDAEVEQLYELALDRGEGRPALVVEDPDQTSGLNERLHYGTFERFERYGRENPQQTRWGLTVEQWV